MPDRLDALLRQRALVQEHLAWLDSEIAASLDRPEGTSSGEPLARPASNASPAEPQRPLSPRPTISPAAQPAPTASSSVPATVALAQADEILETYRTPQTSLKSDVRKGCLLYFVAALALVALGVTALYFLIGSRR